MRPASLSTAELIGAATVRYPGLEGPDIAATSVALAVIAVTPSNTLTAVLDRDKALGQHLANGNARPFGFSPVKRSLLGIYPSDDVMDGARELTERFWKPVDPDGTKPEAPVNYSEDYFRSTWGRGPRSHQIDAPHVRARIGEEAASENHAIRRDALAAAGISEYYRKMKRHSIGRHVGAWLMIGLIGGGAFLLRTHDHNISTTSVVNSSKKVEIPYTVNDSITVTAGTLNITASNYDVPPSTITTDQKALENEMAKAHGSKYRVRQISIFGFSSQAPVNGGNFYELPASGRYAAPEEADLQSEDRVARIRAGDAEIALDNAANNSRNRVEIPPGSVTTASEMVPPTAEQLQEIDKLASANGKFRESKNLHQ